MPPAGWLDWAREALTATLAAQILALPLILYQFGNLSLIAPLANVILLPHVGSNTADANRRMAERALRNIMAAEAGEIERLDLINPEVLTAP